VRLGRKVHNRVDVVLLDRLMHLGGIADIPQDKGKAGILGHILKVIRVACIGQLVVYDDAIVRMGPQHIVDKVRANKACSTCDEDVLHGSP